MKGTPSVSKCLKLSFWSILILLAAYACDEAGPSSGSPESELPNIILLVGDDQGYPYFGFMGADYVYTPNMDSLASRGLLFTNGYVPQNHCRLSLQTLMTGTLPVQYEGQVEELIRSRDIPDTAKRDFRFHAMKYFETLPRVLANHGYRSFQGGKWWEFNYQNGGFDEGMTTGWEEGDLNKKEWFHKFMGGDGTQLARATMQPVYDFIDSSKNQPFFIWFAPELPHYPFDAPDKYYNLYKDKDMTESAKRYYANCTWFDDGVGELNRYLREVGEWDNTLFVYVNDNGWEQEPNQEFRHDSLRWHNGGDKGKLSVYDQSFRTPIIFSWKDKIKPGKSEALVHSADIPVTILDMLGLSFKAPFGKSLMPLISGKTDSHREAIVGRSTQMRSEEDYMGMKIDANWVRTPSYFYKINRTTGTEALYDLEKDPRNDQDIKENHPDALERMTSLIVQWRKEMEGKETVE